MRFAKRQRRMRWRRARSYLDAMPDLSFEGDGDPSEEMPGDSGCGPIAEGPASPTCPSA